MTTTKPKVYSRTTRRQAIGLVIFALVGLVFINFFNDYSHSVSHQAEHNVWLACVQAAVTQDDLAACGAEPPTN